MNSKSKQINWQTYLAKELPTISSLLSDSGYSLQTDQPHLKGERAIIQSLTTQSGHKLILLGEKNEKKVVIKATGDKAGMAELERERRCRLALSNLNFAYDKFYAPREIEFIKRNGYVISVYEFIEQDSPFLDRPIAEQFTISLRGFKIQERARATTRKHFKKAANIFGERNSDKYKRLFTGFELFLQKENVDKFILENVYKTKEKLHEGSQRIEQYCGFLTHTDFVPHNFRVKNNVLYLLDFSSFILGNKHESWARFLNFMTLYNTELERLLIQYLEDNRAPEERESLQLMRLFRLGELITYHQDKVNKSTGDLQELSKVRVRFWNDVLAAELENRRVDRNIVERYKQTRDKLRSQEEKERQIGLH